jgi:phosphodiesterase/alkaline phosphatase D-like protein
MRTPHQRQEDQSEPAPAFEGLDRRKLLKGAAVLAASTAMASKAASAATERPFGETGVRSEESYQ